MGVFYYLSFLLKYCKYEFSSEGLFSYPDCKALDPEYVINVISS